MLVNPWKRQDTMSRKMGFDFISASWKSDKVLNTDELRLAINHEPNKEQIKNEALNFIAHLCRLKGLLLENSNLIHQFVIDSKAQQENQQAPVCDRSFFRRKMTKTSRECPFRQATENFVLQAKDLLVEYFILLNAIPNDDAMTKASSSDVELLTLIGSLNDSILDIKFAMASIGASSGLQKHVGNQFASEQPHVAKELYGFMNTFKETCMGLRDSLDNLKQQVTIHQLLTYVGPTFRTLQDACHVFEKNPQNQVKSFK